MKTDDEYEKLEVAMTDDEKFALPLLAENSPPIKQFYEALEEAVQLAEKAMFDLAEKCAYVSCHFDGKQFGEECKIASEVLRITVNNFHENPPVCPEINTAKLNTAAFALRKCGAKLVLNADNVSQVKEVKEVFAALDEFSDLARKTRLNIEEQVKDKNDSIRSEILHALENKDWNMANSLLALTGQLAMLSSRCEFVHWQAPELRLRMNQNDRFLAEGILPREFESLLADRIGQPVRLCIEFPVQEAATAKQEWEPVSVRAINEAIAPLSITTAGLEYFGFHSVETKGRAVLYPASVIAPLCLAAAQHLQNVAKAHEV